MATDKQNYPQIPNRVWWGVRKILQSRPTAKLSDQVLASHLSVQPSAAKAYLKQFQIVGLLDDEGGATSLTNKWRNDPTYSEAIDEILHRAYPSELVDNYPVGEADIQKVTEWFQYGGLGAGTARNKASTYVLIANGKPNDAEEIATPRQRKVEGTDSKPPKARAVDEDPKVSENRNNNLPEMPSLNLNIQIHISADASKDQIENIFSAMSKYLRQ